MFRFLSKTISPSTQKLLFSQTLPCLSPKFISTPSKTREDSDTVIEFFHNLGFSRTKSSKMVQYIPAPFRTDPAKKMQPKIDFLKSKGFSDSEIRNIVSGYPTILRRSLEREIIPSFDFFTNMFHSQHKFMKTVVRYSGVICDLENCSVLNLEYLREEGVPESLVIRFVEYFPRSLKAPPKRSKELVQEVRELGFNPLRLQFVMAVHIKVCLSRSTWARKEGVFRKWGWSDDDFLVAFKVHPFFMSVSECKIEAIMDFLVNKLGFVASEVARYSVVLSMSLGKRITPRGSVVLLLKSKGLLKKVSLGTIFRYDEELFLDRFIYCHEMEADELLKLYKAKLSLAE